MPTDKEKMLAGDLYWPWDAELASERAAARLLVTQSSEASLDQPAA